MPAPDLATSVMASALERLVPVIGCSNLASSDGKDAEGAECGTAGGTPQQHHRSHLGTCWTMRLVVACRDGQRWVVVAEPHDTVQDVLGQLPHDHAQHEVSLNGAILDRTQSLDYHNIKRDYVLLHICHGHSPFPCAQPSLPFLAGVACLLGPGHCDGQLPDPTV